MIRVIGEKVLIKVVKNEEQCTQKIGSISIPVGPNAGEYEIAEVIGVGDKVEAVKIGEKMYIYFGAGKKFVHESEEYRVITLNEIIAIL